MKGIILAGGHGTRLRPLTNITNKHLIAVYDKPMIEYPLKTLVDAGCKDILVVSGREYAGDFLEYLGSGRDRELEFTYRVQEEAGGIAQALGLAEKFAEGQEVIVILGDNYYEYTPDFSTLTGNNIAGLVLKEVSDPHRFGVYDFKTKTIAEKPKRPKSNMAVTGLYWYPNDVFNVIKTLKPSLRGELEVSDINQYYLAEARIATTNYEGFWSDMGTPESLGRTIEFIMNRD